MIYCSCTMWQLLSFLDNPWRQLLQQMKAKDFKKQDYVLLAKLAQQTERFEEMTTFADQILLSQEELIPPERNLCASAYKSVVASRRAELKVINAMQSKAKPDDPIICALDRYKAEISQDMAKTCHHIIKLLEEEVLPSKNHIKGAEAIVFFKKMIADFNRYLCELMDQEASRQYRQHAENNYKEAQTIAHSNLPQTNPVRLSLHLNMSVFLWEVSGEHEAALNMANRAFEEAIANIDTVNEQNYKECTMILQLIRDNISLWSGDEQ